MRQTEIFDILGHFLPFHPPDNLENRNFNIEKTPRDTIILHIHSLNPPFPPLYKGGGGIDFLKFSNKGGDKIFFLEREGLD